MAKTLQLKPGHPPQDQLIPVLQMQLGWPLEPTSYPDLTSPDKLRMLQEELSMLLAGEQPIEEMISSSSSFELDDGRPLFPNEEDKFPFRWSVVLKDKAGTVWTEIVDDAS
jgi:hypothetical protein